MLRLRKTQHVENITNFMAAASDITHHNNEGGVNDMRLTAHDSSAQIHHTTL